MNTSVPTSAKLLSHPTGYGAGWATAARTVVAIHILAGQAWTIRFTSVLLGFQGTLCRSMGTGVWRYCLFVIR
jgi:hypothetical protein